MHSFIDLRNGFRELLWKWWGWGIQGWMGKAQCRPFSNCCLHIYLPFPASFLLSMHAATHTPQPFLVTLTSGKMIFMLISLRYAFLGQTGLLSGFFMKSSIFFWVRRIIDWERLSENIKFSLPLQTTHVFESCTANLWLIWLLFWYMLWTRLESGQCDF